MMYGFGDDPNPYAESVDLLEDIVVEFITETVRRASRVDRHIFSSVCLDAKGFVRREKGPCSRGRYHISY